MKEARSIFQKMYDRFPANIKAMNILLLGFKESGNISAMELFYHEMARRGFKPVCSTYGIRIDAYCKKGCFGDALRIFEEMERVNCLPTLETITTLIHGAGVAQNKFMAQELFKEIPHNVGAYNALLSSLIRCRDLNSAVRLMGEMEEKYIGYDNVTYHTMFMGFMRESGIEDVSELYHRMIEREFVPKTRTVVMWMKFFCVIGWLDLGLNFWGYLVDKGCCPHGHALDLLVAGLCSHGRLTEAFECSKQFIGRGMCLNEAVYHIFAGSQGCVDSS